MKATVGTGSRAFVMAGSPSSASDTIDTMVTPLPADFMPTLTEEGSLGGRRVPGFVPGRAARDADRGTFQRAVWLPNEYTRATGPTRWEPLLGNDEAAHCA